MDDAIEILEVHLRLCERDLADTQRLKDRYTAQRDCLEMVLTQLRQIRDSVPQPPIKGDDKS